MSRSSSHRGAEARAVVVVLFALAALTDLGDGWLARRRGETSLVGATLDPIADKALVVALCIALLGSGEIQGWHSLAVVVIVLRELLVTALRAWLAMQPRPAGDGGGGGARCEAPSGLAPRQVEGGPSVPRHRRVALGSLGGRGGRGGCLPRAGASVARSTDRRSIGLGVLRFGARGLGARGLGGRGLGGRVRAARALQ